MKTLQLELIAPFSNIGIDTLWYYASHRTVIGNLPTDCKGFMMFGTVICDYLSVHQLYAINLFTHSSLRLRQKVWA